MTNIGDLSSYLIKVLFENRGPADNEPVNPNPVQTNIVQTNSPTLAIPQDSIPVTANSVITIVALLDSKGGTQDSMIKNLPARPTQDNAPGTPSPQVAKTSEPAAAPTNWASIFTKGETMTGTVTKSLSPDSAIIRMRGTDMVASTPQRLPEGAPITVRVESLRPQFVLSILPTDARVQEKTAAVLRAVLPAEIPVSDVIKNLTELLPKLPPQATNGSGLEQVLKDINQAATKPAEQAKNPLQLFGLSHEAGILSGKPAPNLKHSLLVVRQNLEKINATSSGTHVEQLQKVNDAISNIEVRQLMSGADTGNIKGWQTPYWNGEKIDSAMLYIGKDDPEKAAKKGEPAVRITLMLNMTNLGAIRTDAVGQKDRLEATIYAASDSAVKKLEGGLKGLTAALGKAGFSTNINVQLADESFLARAPKEAAPLPVETLLNLRV
jgi:hypothetical protein